MKIILPISEKCHQYFSYLVESLYNCEYAHIYAYSNFMSSFVSVIIIFYLQPLSLDTPNVPHLKFSGQWLSQLGWDYRADNVSALSLQVQCLLHISILSASQGRVTGNRYFLKHKSNLVAHCLQTSITSTACRITLTMVYEAFHSLISASLASLICKSFCSCFIYPLMLHQE